MDHHFRRAGSLCCWTLGDWRNCLRNKLGRQQMRVNGKEAFLHDADARNDDRILELRASCGAAGYGMYWMLIESMRTASNYKLARSRSSALAFGFGVSHDDLEQVIQVCLTTSLFITDEILFWSDSLLKRMAEYERRCEVNRTNRSGKTHNDPPSSDDRATVVERPNNTTQSNLIELDEGECEGEKPPPRLTLAPRITMTEKQRDELVLEFGAESLRYHAPVCSDWLISNGKTKSNYASFVRNWIRKEIAEQKGFYHPSNRRLGAASVAALNGADRAKQRIAATQEQIKKTHNGEAISPEKAAEILARLKVRK